VDAKWLVPNPPRLGATAPQKRKNMFRLSKFRRHFGRDSKNSRIRGLNGKSYQKTLRGLIVGLLETIQPGHFFLKIFVNTVARGVKRLKNTFSPLRRPLAAKPLQIRRKLTGPFAKYPPSTIKRQENIHSTSYHYGGVAPQKSLHTFFTLRTSHFP